MRAIGEHPLVGEARFCGMSKDGCRELTQVCDYVVATPDGLVSEVRQADQSILQELGNRNALPFQTGDQKLSPEFEMPSCIAVAGGLAPITVFGILIGGGIICGIICDDDDEPASR